LSGRYVPAVKCTTVQYGRASLTVLALDAEVLYGMVDGGADAGAQLCAVCAMM
jgi:hypothetical protein